MQCARVVTVGMALLAADCETAPQPAPATADLTTSRVVAHGPETRALQRAIADGRLTDLRDRAHWLAAQQLDDATTAAARRIEHAPDGAAASAELGSLGRACSGCHVQRDVRVTRYEEPVPADDGTLAAQMQRHAWGAARLWQGVSGPADEAWAEGARVMATTPFAVGRMMHERPNVEVVELAGRLAEQTTRAATLIDRDARATLLGEVMGTCAACHRIVHPQPVASR